MKNILGYLKKTLIFCSTFILIFSFSPFKAYSDEEFNISSSFKHTVTENNQVETVVDISIQANNNSRVLSFFTITIPQEEIEPTVSILNSEKEVTTTVYHKNNVTDIAAVFTDLIISDTKATTLRISYTTDLESEGNKFVFHSKLTDIDTSSITILFPKDMGEIVWSSNTVSKFSSQGNLYKTEINNPSSSDEILVLGDSLVYNFSISRSLNNTLQESSQTFDITLPQDNSSQTLIIASLDPLPDSSSRDEEGNLTVSYTVEPEEQIDVSISGYILTMDSNTQIEKPTNPLFIKQSGFWKITDNQEITNINRYIDRNWIDLPDNFEGVDDLTSDSSKESFYKGIYKYIVNRLEVDTESSTVLQGGSRDGASAVLEDVSKADADDYADLCVAVYRYYDIPARMVVGFLTDVSGITDDGIFHSWCEYYDEVEQSWISLDPFLEDYKGVDIYHNSLKDHIKIITRGKSSVSPKLAFYSTNDFRASSTSDEVTPSLNFTAEILFEKVSTISKYIKGSIVINNTGNIPLTQFTILEENIPISEHIDLISNEAILLLLPGESISIPFNIPIEEIGSYNTEIPVSVSMEVSSESQFSKESEIISSLEVSTPLWLNLLSYSLVSLFFFVIVFLIYFVYRRFRK
jgi:hypothetical protein